MFYQLKITRKGTKPPVWRRCTVAADVTFANMAAMLEKLVQYPAGSLYEIEFFQKKVQIRENGDGEAKNNFTLLNAGETETAELMDSEKWFTFRQYGADKETPEYRVDIEKKDEGIAEAPSIIKEVKGEDDPYWTEAPELGCTAAVETEVETAKASDAFTDRKSLTSGRKLQTGLMLDTDIRSDNSYTSGILFGQYLLKKLGNYRRPAAAGLNYQVEYILGGKNSDRENLKSVAGKLLVIRQGVNMAYLLSDSGKRIQVETLALAIASGFLIPPAAAVIEAALIFCWAFAESILDVRELFAGGHVPLIKNSSDWQLSLSNLPNILDKLDSSRKDAGNGMSYEDYLQVLLMAKGKQDKILRGMDMIECSVREKGKRPGFQMDHCITAMEASADVKANRRKIFTVTRQYAYE